MGDPGNKINPPHEEAPGALIGRYKILEKAGEGGFGVVYVAEQREPVKRRVALKIIKLGMDTRQVVGRFEAERQALALMDHPNIAKVLDAGATETGRPFFVMELVRGVRITDYCDQNKLSVPARLQLFIQVCHAIQHAHQKGIIHRDIKPSNILVTLHDGVPVPKVIDFGIAKATQGRLTDQTLFTAFEQFIGTPAYMSPEQAEMSGLDIDTRTDIYSLGVLLYELLTGRAPFDSEKLLAAGVDALRRTIRDQEPPRPSSQLGTMQAEALTQTALHRNTDPPRLIRFLRGDLDWVVMKALEKDRTRRYETANGLAMDVQRYANDEPVIARPPARLYRLQKALHRNKLAFSAASITALALLASALVSTVHAVRASRAEKQARQDKDAATQARHQAEAISRFLTDDLLYQAAPDQNAREKKVTMEEVLEKAALKLEQDPNLVKQPEIEATLRFAIGTTFHRLGLLREAERHLRRAVHLYDVMGRQDRQALSAQRQLCDLLLSQMMRLEDGEQLSLNTWKGFQRLAQAEPSDKTLYRDLLNAQATWIWALTLRGEYEKAIPLKRQNIADFERTFGADDLETLTEWGNLANMMLVVGNHGEMEIIARQTRDRLQRAGLGDRQETFAITVMLAQSLLCQDHAPEALSILQEAHPRAVRALGPDAPQTLLVQYTLARALAEQGAQEEAERLAREALDLQLRADNPNHWNTGNMLLVLGRLLVAKSQFDEAQTCLQRACSLFQASHFTHKSEKLAVAENLLGAVHLARTNYFEATRLIEPNAERFVTPRGILAISPGERRDAFKQILNLYRALDKPDKVETWQRRIEHFGKWTGKKQPGPVRLSTHDPARSSP